MKKCILVFIIAFATTGICSAQEQLLIDRTASSITWSGEYTFYFGGHTGTINFKEGYFTKRNNVIDGGVFIIDMNSIRCLDIDNLDGRKGLEGHLKDPDFFFTTQFPEAKLVIKSVDYQDNTHMKVYADLTIKGITKPIDFQAEVDYKKEQMTTRFKIDRRLWDISYKSSLQDGSISDGIGFEVTVTLL